MIKKRRELLVKLLGIPVALMALENDLSFSGNKINLVFNDDPMSFLEDIVATRWKIHLMGGPLNAAHGLERVVKEVAHFRAGSAWESVASASYGTTLYDVSAQGKRCRRHDAIRASVCHIQDSLCSSK